MTMTEQFNDWFIRYNLLYKKRYTKHQKQRFLQSFVSDLLSIRKDVEVRKDKQDKNSFHIVVGDLKKAKHVIATYYDTPAIYQGDYYVFSVEKQKKQTTNTLMGLSLIMLILGILFTYFIGIPVFEKGGISYQTFLLVLFYFVFFYIFGQVTRGWPEKNNLIRNTSSLLYMLNFIKENSDPTLAFVFYDHGCQGDTSTKKVRKKLNLNSQRLTILDSVGAEGELVRVARNDDKKAKMPTIIAKEWDANFEYLTVMTHSTKVWKELVLKKQTLKEKELNYENYQNLDDFFN
jgi:hypothetical protein